MKSPSVFNRSNRNMDVAMTPMIDVVFLLLVFFVWTASFQAVEYLMPSRLSNMTGGTSETEVSPELLDLEQVVVRLVNDNGQLSWLVNDEPLSDLQQVETRLSQVAAIRNDLPVIVDPDPIVSIGDVIDVYDAATVAGFENVQFTTS